ncbi:MAG TPA: M67 family metallopeptidase [bacterium]|jgi:adenylyltransferase/sulfurtransferase
MTRPPLTIPPALLERCFAHGAGTYPEEGCGVLSGPAGSAAVDGYHPVPNILNRMHAEDPERYPRTGSDGYFMDPAEMMRLEKALAREGRAVKVIFHSHVDVGAYFSQEDKTRALWAGEPLLPGMVYLVCGVKARQPDGAILAWFDEAARDFATAPVEG